VSFPINRVSYREFAPDWSGEVFSCDIDRTYLATRFSSLKGMARIPFELAIDKQDIAGMAALLKEVRRGPGRESRHTPLYFLSASPPQLRSVIERKMLLDGLEYDGTTFKDWLGVVRSRRLKRFREQIGFKITALLRARLDLPWGARDVLIGDDLESDGLAYSLYADILARRLNPEHVEPMLRRLGVAEDDAKDIVTLSERVKQAAPVRGICIRLERHEASEFLDFAPHLVAARGAFQMVVGLYARGCVSLDGVVRVARDLVHRGMSRDGLLEHLLDAIRRCIAAADEVEKVRSVLVNSGLAADQPFDAEADSEWARAADCDPSEPWVPARFRE